MKIQQYQQQVKQSTVVGYRQPTTSVKTQAQQIKASEAAAKAAKTQDILNIGLQALSLGDQIAQSQSEAELLETETELYKRLDEFTLSLDEMSWTEYFKAWEEERTRLQNELSDGLKIPRSKRKFEQFFERQANEYEFTVRELESDRRNAQSLATGLKTIDYHTQKGTEKHLGIALTTIKRLENAYIISPVDADELEKATRQKYGYWAVRNQVATRDMSLQEGLTYIEGSAVDIGPEVKEDLKSWWKDEYNFRNNQYKTKYTELNRKTKDEVTKKFWDRTLKEQDVLNAVIYDDFRAGEQGQWYLTAEQKDAWVTALHNRKAAEEKEKKGKEDPMTKPTWVHPGFRAEINQMLQDGTDREDVLRFIDDSFVEVDEQGRYLTYHPAQWDELYGLVDNFRPDLNLDTQQTRFEVLADDDEVKEANMNQKLDQAIRARQGEDEDLTAEDVEKIADEIIAAEIEPEIEGWFNQIKSGGATFRTQFMGGVEGEDDLEKLKRIEKAIQSGEMDPKTARAAYEKEIKRLYELEIAQFEKTFGFYPSDIVFDAEHQIEQVLLDEHGTHWTYNEGVWTYYNPKTDGWVKVRRPTQRKRQKIADILRGVEGK
jgi:hypothetical protein